MRQRRCPSQSDGRSFELPDAQVISGMEQAVLGSPGERSGAGDAPLARGGVVTRHPWEGWRVNVAFTCVNVKKAKQKLRKNGQVRTFQS